MSKPCIECGVDTEFPHGEPFICHACADKVAQNPWRSIAEDPPSNQDADDKGMVDILMDKSKRNYCRWQFCPAVNQLAPAITQWRHSLSWKGGVS